MHTPGHRQRGAGSGGCPIRPAAEPSLPLTPSPADAGGATLVVTPYRLDESGRDAAALVTATISITGAMLILVLRPTDPT